ncbi:dienelactone hydrolase [uncultured Paraglaciecola sp.]|uniref:alpha/beta hydrolase family protein n=1 Tax=uncultured Paraglaciecola sp. TaxID=1765024 RepID=UPI0030D7C536|tara:strand:- start:84635 stop:85957 length:1323 start_codon:yes stop_codon:yes gene_type:complete
MFYEVLKRSLLLVIISSVSTTCFSENRIDTQRPDAPDLAAYGQYAIGVRTLKVVHSQQIDIAKFDASKPNNLPRYDRPLTLEIWYPAAANSKGNTTLDVYLRDGKTKVAIKGKAVRDANPIQTSQQFPLVIISHGYPGNRFLLSHLAENIASKGYVVVSIDHTDSTYRTKAAFGSTLVNRPLDQLFTLDQIQLKSKDKSSFLFELVNPQNTALIGYSMGGYGAVISAGGGVTQQAVDYPWGLPNKALAIHQNPEQTPKYPDPRLKTVIAFAPWGMNYGVWDQTTLKGVKIPMFFVAGSVDDISGYEKGIRSIWQATTKVDRALLTFDNANHSAGAPMPAPEESFVYDEELGFAISDHYTDAVWDTVRMNNISQHFVTAWLEKYLKDNTHMDPYFNLVTHSNDGVWSMDKAGQPKADHSHWKGFNKGTAKGLRFEKLGQGE